MKDKTYPLKAGAGRCEIAWEPEILPRSKRETYTRILDRPCIRIIVLDSEERFLIVAAELANMDRKVQKDIICMLEEKASVKEDHIFFHLNHVHSTPHGWGPFDMEDLDEKEKAKMAPFYNALYRAAEEALIKALNTLRPARVGTGKGICGSAIVNRNVQTDQGWWLGSNEAGEKDDTVGIIRLDDMHGDTIAILFVYYVVPSVLDYSTRDFEPGLERVLSADLAGYSSAFVEAEYPGAVAAYLTGAAGDVWPSYCAMYQLVGRGGKLRTVDLGDAGGLLAKLQGERLGQQVVAAAEEIVCGDLEAPVSLRFDTFSYDGRNENSEVHEMRPARKCEFVSCGETREMEIPFLFIGNEIVLAGLHCQTGIHTIREIQKQSPYALTGILSFTSIGGKDKYGPKGIRKYAPERDAYEKVQYMAQNSVVMPGAAEELCQRMVSFLQQQKV